MSEGCSRQRGLTWDTAGGGPCRVSSGKEEPVMETPLSPGPGLGTALRIQAVGAAR